MKYQHTIVGVNKDGITCRGLQNQTALNASPNYIMCPFGSLHSMRRAASSRVARRGGGDVLVHVAARRLCAHIYTAHGRSCAHVARAHASRGSQRVIELVNQRRGAHGRSAAHCGASRRQKHSFAGFARQAVVAHVPKDPFFSKAAARSLWHWRS